MAVFRIERTHNYTVMSNYHLRDKGLSLKAKGLLSQMLSLPENWDYTLAGLARINAEGKDAIRAAVAELERAGYLVRSRTRDEKGRLLGTEYIIREQPIFSAELVLEEPTSENPTLEEPTQLNKEKNKIPDSQSTEFISFPSAPPTGPALAEKAETKGWKRMNRVSKGEMDSYRELIRENICYDDFVREHPCDASQLDEMVELMVEAVCSRKENLRVAGNDFPQAVVKSRLLKLNGEHIRFVFDCLRENTTQVRNMKQYLLTVLYNTPVTMESHYAAKVNHDLYGIGAA
ncbi:MAG: helix-turn-helix domain-containing protein [Oscillospiraceae bacterium]|nr:helix-turn-helix domain-containing protein [Oscillospiraceae bacterium]